MVAYLKPPGYNTLAFVNGLVGRWYKPWNGYASGDQNYSPGALTAQRTTFTFSAAPANGSQITVPDGPLNDPATPTRTFTFTWAGSPGTGIIPLVAGGGTAAQAATAAAVAMAAQLTNWTVTNPASTLLLLVSRQKGVNALPASVGTTNGARAVVLSSLLPVLPARFGKNYAFLPATPGPIVGS